MTRAEVKAFKAATRAAGRYWGGSRISTVLVLVVVCVFAGFALIGLFGNLLSATFMLSTTGDAFAFTGIAPPLVFLAFFGAVIFLVARALTSMGSWERWLRLSRFADANGLVFSATDADPSYPGAIFGLGSQREVTDHLRSTSDRFLDIGNYTYVTGSGKSRTTHRWGFMAIALDRSMPNMVLDSKANNGLFGGTNLPTYFSKDQVLSLEGDFDKHFTLYCPKQYERDALYVFTPDLMALLIDEVAPFDVEIVDRWMFVYSSGSFPVANPATYQRLFRIIDTVGSKTLSQTERYADDRVGDFAANIVAPQGRRLRRGWSVGAVIAIVLFAALWLLPNVLDIVRP